MGQGTTQPQKNGPRGRKPYVAAVTWPPCHGVFLMGKLEFSSWEQATREEERVTTCASCGFKQCLRQENAIWHV